MAWRGWFVLFAFLIGCGGSSSSPPREATGTGGTAGTGGATGTGGSTGTAGSTGSGGATGTGGITGTGGTTGTGGVTGTGGMGGFGGFGENCHPSGPGCRWYKNVYPESTTLRDDDSQRRVVAQWCGESWDETVVRDVCQYDETCESSPAPEGSEYFNTATCVSCGRKGDEFTLEMVDGEVVRDCVGCYCSSGTVYCSLTAGKLPPHAWVRWSSTAVSATGIETYIETDGSIVNVHGPDYCIGYKSCSRTVEVIQLDLQPPGTVEIDLQINAVFTDPFGVDHDVYVHLYRVATCNYI